MTWKSTLVCAFATASVWAQGGYSGPQILSRGVGTLGERPGRSAGISVYAGLTGTYETGIVPASVNSQGEIVELDSLAGIQANLGAYGRKTWRKAVLGLDYTGNFRHYGSNTYLDGIDQIMSLGVSAQTSRRVQLYTKTAAGTLSQYYTGGLTTIPDFIGVPAYNIFDNRLYYVQNSTGVVYTPTARLSFNASGTGFLVRRQSSSLVDTNGYGATGTVDYRLSKTRTLQGYYTYGHFDYPHGFGETDIHTPMLGIAQRLGRRWEVGLSGGVSQVHTIGVEQVSVDPITAALFGTTTSIRAFDRTIYFAAIRGALRGAFRSGVLDLSVQQLPNPGNGVYLTSKQTAASGTYTYTAVRRTSISLSVNYNATSSIGQEQIGPLYYTSGGVAVSYKILRSLEAVARYDARNLTIDQTTGFTRLSYRVAFGLTWNPSEFPVSFW